MYDETDWRMDDPIASRRKPVEMTVRPSAVGPALQSVDIFRTTATALSAKENGQMAQPAVDLRSTYQIDRWNIE